MLEAKERKPREEKLDVFTVRVNIINDIATGCVIFMPKVNLPLIHYYAFDG